MVPCSDTGSIQRNAVEQQLVGLVGLQDGGLAEELGLVHSGGADVKEQRCPSVRTAAT